MSTMRQQQTISNTTQTLSPAKKNIKKHRELIGKYIKCSRCSEETCYIYLEDNRYRTRCLTCGDNNYLKLI